MKKFLNEYHYEIPVLVDGKEDVRRRYGIRSIPTLLVIDRDGVVRQAFVGSRGESALRKSIQAALDAKPGGPIGFVTTKLGSLSYPELNGVPGHYA